MKPQSADIQQIILEALNRYESGRERLGQLDLKTDSRDFTGEAIEELIDCINYCVFTILKLRNLQRP